MPSERSQRTREEFTRLSLNCSNSPTTYSRNSTAGTAGVHLTSFSTLVSAKADEILESNQRELSGLNVRTPGPILRPPSARSAVVPFAAGSHYSASCGRREGDGAKRQMMCSFCLQDWDFRRIYCPACGEEDEKKLPVYVAEQFPHIRVEVCETCKVHLRTIDLTTNGNAVPVVDDLAAIPLSLWGQEQGYTRLHPNLLGT
jgi:Protein involved in formate dehydrogenase formation